MMVFLEKINIFFFYFAKLITNLGIQKIEQASPEKNLAIQNQGSLIFTEAYKVFFFNIFVTQVQKALKMMMMEEKLYTIQMNMDF